MGYPAPHSRYWQPPPPLLLYNKLQVVSSPGSTRVWLHWTLTMYDPRLTRSCPCRRYLTKSPAWHVSATLFLQRPASAVHARGTSSDVAIITPCHCRTTIGTTVTNHWLLLVGLPIWVLALLISGIRRHRLAFIEIEEKNRPIPSSWHGLSSSEQPIGGTKPWHNSRFAVTSRSWRELNNPGKQVAAPGSCRQSPTFPEHPDGEASAVTNSYYHFTASLPFGASPQMRF